MQLNNQINDYKYTAARCYVATSKNPQFKGILGLGDELSTLYSNPNKSIYGIGNEVSQLERNKKVNDRNTIVNEGSLTSTIKITYLRT